MKCPKCGSEMYQPSAVGPQPLFMAKVERAVQHRKERIASENH